MATTVHEPPKIEERRDPSRPADNSGNGGRRNLVPADGKLPGVKDYSPPPASTGIWVVLASITMSFAAFTSALIVRQGSALDWRHLTLPPILYLNTLVLFASSFALEVARRRWAPSWPGERDQAARPNSLVVHCSVSGSAFCGRPVRGVDAVAFPGPFSGHQSQQFFFLRADGGPRRCMCWAGWAGWSESFTG